MSFKVGNKVEYNRTYDSVPYGTKGEVKDTRGSRVLVKWDNWHEGWGEGLRYWWVDDVNIKLIEDSETGLYIVVVEQDGKLAPAETPKTYKTKAQAEHVAKDMAKRHGGKFLVFKATFEVTNIVTERSL